MSLSIHILLPHLGELFNKYQQEISRIDIPDVYGNVAYNAFESLAHFYNRKVLNRELMIFMKVMIWISSGNLQ